MVSPEVSSAVRAATPGGTAELAAAGDPAPPVDVPGAPVVELHAQPSKRADGPADELSARIVLAATECIARWGWERTKVDDIAAAARCSRASVYRKFDDKAQILDEVLAGVGADMVLAVDRALEERGGAASLRASLSSAMVAAAAEFETNRTVAELIRTDRKAILPLIAFDRLDPIIKRYSSHLADLLEPHTASRSDAVAITGWATRVLLAYVFSPGTPRFRLTDEAVVDHLVSTYLLPGFVRGTESSP